MLCMDASNKFSIDEKLVMDEIEKDLQARKPELGSCHEQQPESGVIVSVLLH